MTIKKIVFFLIVTLSFYSSYMPQNVAEANPVTGQEENYKALTLALLNPYIRLEINNYYLKNHKPTPSYGLYDIKVVELKRLSPGGYLFRTVLEVSTFNGPHNPPYGQEVITFEVGPATVKTIRYVHKDS